MAPVLVPTALRVLAFIGPFLEVARPRKVPLDALRLTGRHVLDPGTG